MGKIKKRIELFYYKLNEGKSEPREMVKKLFWENYTKTYKYILNNKCKKKQFLIY